MFQSFTQTLQLNGLQPIKMSMYLRKREQIVVFVYVIKKLGTTSKFINSVWYAESLCQQFISGYFDGLENSTFLEL